MKDELRCSFCGKGQRQAQVLVAGPISYICEDCVELAKKIIDSRRTEDAARNRQELSLSPVEQLAADELVPNGVRLAVLNPDRPIRWNALLLDPDVLQAVEYTAFKSGLKGTLYKQHDWGDLESHQLSRCIAALVDWRVLSLCDDRLRHESYRFGKKEAAE